jgi:hypothetical protein
MSEAAGGQIEGRPIHLRTRFERFPASVKGAFVLQGADGNPHSARIVEAAVARIPSGPKKPVPLDDRILDVAPARDLFVPFEVSVSELEPSWYVIESAIEVDGWRTWSYASRPFTIPWPRSDVRRGTVAVGRPVTVKGRKFVVERVEFGADMTAVVWRPEGTRSPSGGAAEPGRPSPNEEAVVIVDGSVIELLPSAAGSSRPERLAPGERKTTFYPVPRSARSVEVRVRVPGAAESDPLPVPLH